MKIAYLIPGTGEAFYCENCHRDLPLIGEMRKLNHEILAIPLYLPLLTENSTPGGDTRIFFGAIDMYLAQKIPLYRRFPRRIRRALDNPSLLSFAARFAGSTSPDGLEPMTLHMLDPDYQRESCEAENLLRFLKESQADIIHISNALLLGLGIFLKRELNVPLICTLQDEDTWIDDMASPYREEAWIRIGKLSRETDRFLPVSSHYGELFRSKIDRNDLEYRIIPIGLKGETYPYTFNGDEEEESLSIAYLSHQKEGLGLDILAEAFQNLRKTERLSRLKLLISGGSTSSDRSFVRKVKKSLGKEIAMGDVVYFPSFELDERIRLLSQADVLSVPMERGEAFGTYLIEAMACGVPVVQPCSGAFPEIIGNTGGGILYDCGDHDSLYEQLKILLDNRDLREELAKKGRQSVLEKYSQKMMAEETARVYEEFL